MCIAIACIGDAHPPRVELDKSCQVNSHGFGYGFVVECDGERELITFKSMDANEVVEKYLMAFVDFVLEEKTVIASVFHARISTHGDKTVENCHPFQIGDDTQSVLIHNGILPVRMDANDTRSDTHVFAAEVLPLMGGIDALNHVHLWDMLEEYIGSSKVVILSSRMSHALAILGEKRGHWNDETNVWYSNASYKTYSGSSYSRGGAYRFDDPSTHSAWCRCAAYCRDKTNATTTTTPALGAGDVDDTDTTTGGRSKRAKKRQRARERRATYSDSLTFEDTLVGLSEAVGECEWCDAPLLPLTFVEWCHKCGGCQVCGEIRDSYEDQCPCEVDSVTSIDLVTSLDPAPLESLTPEELSEWAREVMDFLAAFPDDPEAVEMRRELDIELARRAGEEIDTRPEPEPVHVHRTYNNGAEGVSYLARDTETGMLRSFTFDEFNTRYGSQVST